MDDFRALLPSFLDETQPLVEWLGEAFLELERSWKAGERDPEGVARARSTLHTIKGNAAMMGFQAIQLVAHVLEDACETADASPDEAIAELVIEGGDLLHAMMIACQSGTPDEHAAELFVARAQASKQHGKPNGKPHGSRRPRNGAPPTATTTAAGTPSTPPPAAVHLGGGPRGTDSIRVSFRRLDEMLALVGEAMITHAALVEQVSGHERAEQPASTLGKTLRALHGTLMEARLVPLSTLFSRFERYVRDLGREQHQEIRLVTRGGDTPIDKTLIDRLSEPLLHIVRNAVAHGIEPRAARLAAGKPAEATITLAAECRADRVTLSIHDDGRGLDVDAITAGARARGVDTAGMSDDELRRLVFLPGVSTAREVSTLAGRGIGLDVVAATVSTMGGRIELESEPGRGTTFSIDLPLTLAVVKGLLVEVDGDVLVVPIAYVQESLRVPENARDGLHQLDGSWMLRLRERLIHVVDAGVALGVPGPPQRRRYCVVLAAGTRRRGLLVDRLLGHQDVVVKSLDEDLGKPDTISGATILGDGRVVLILDGARLVEQRALAGTSIAPHPPQEARA